MRPPHGLAVLTLLLGVVACGQQGGEAGTAADEAPTTPASDAATFSSAEPESASPESASPESAEAGTPAATARAIPPDFPLDVGMQPDGGDFERVGPSADHDGIGSVDVCGTTVWPPRDFPLAGSLAAAVTGPEYADNRHLAVFADAEAALAALEPARAAVRECRTFENQVWTPIRRDTGYDTVTVGLTYSDGLGSNVFQWTRVGSAVLLVHVYSEGSVESLPRQADEVTRSTGAIAPVMCAYSEAGCAGE